MKNSVISVRSVVNLKDSELGPLPEEWEIIALGSLGTVASGGSAPQGSEYFGGENPFVRVQHLDEHGYEVRRWDLITDKAVRKYRLRLFPPGTIIFPKSGASIRLEKRAILSRPSYLVSHLCAIIPNQKFVDGNFLFFVLRFTRLAAEKAEGYPTLSLTEIKQRLIPIPPLAEQRAIAHVLRTVQEAKQASERVIAALRELKKSLMRALFTYGVRGFATENTEKISVNSVRSVVNLKDTELGPLPEEWQVVKLGEVAERIFAGGDVPKSRFSKVQTNIFTVPIYTNGKDESSLYGFTDIPAVNRTSLTISSRGTIGYSAIRLAPFYPAIRLIVVIPNQDITDLYFMKYAIDLIDFSQHFEKSPIPQFTVPMAKSLLIPLPPLAEQRAIARILQAVDQRIQAEEAYARALGDLFQSLLRELMSGRRRVVMADNDLPTREIAP